MKTYFYFLIVVILFSCASDHQRAIKYFEEANNQFSKENLIISIELYSKALALDNKMTEAYFNRARARLAVVDYQGASDDFTKVIELDPKRADAYLNRGLIKVYKKQFTDEAVQDFNKVIELNPNSADAWYNRGVVYFVQNKREAACHDWKHSLDLGAKKAEQKIKTFCR